MASRRGEVPALALLALACLSRQVSAQGADHEGGNAGEALRCASAKSADAIAAWGKRPRDHAMRSGWWDRAGLPACSRRARDRGRLVARRDRALAINPKDAEALRGRGFTHLHRNETDAAIGDLGAALALNPNDALAYHLRADAHQAKQDLKRAGMDQAMASKLNPKGWPASR